MDIGREVRQIDKDLYSLRLFFREYGKNRNTTKEARGKAYFPNIDEKGKIYLPKNIERNKKGEAYLFLGDERRYLTLSGFGYIIVLKEKNIKQALKKIIKRGDTKIAVCISPFSYRRYPHYISLSDSPLVEKIEKLYKTGSATKNKFKKIEEKQKVLPEMPFLNSNIDICLRPYLAIVKLDVDIVEKDKIEKKIESALDLPTGYTMEERWEKSIERSRQFENAIIKKMRITVPWYFLNFLGINKDNIAASKVVLFDVGEEIEIWEKNAWLNNLNRIRWYSEEAIISFFDENKIKTRFKNSNSAYSSFRGIRVDDIETIEMLDEVINIACF